MTSLAKSRRSRAAFTLIEMLVIISIVLVLATLTTAAVMKFRQTGPRIATQSSLSNINAKVANQAKAVRDKAQAETIPTGVLTSLQQSIGTTQINDPRVRQGYIALRLAQAFPTSFALALQTNMGLPPWSGYVNYLKTLGYPAAPSGLPPQTELAICMMMWLERGPSNTGVTPDSLGATAAKAFTVNGQQAFGCVDAWGNELTFTPTNLQATPPLPAVGSINLP